MKTSTISFVLAGILISTLSFAQTMGEHTDRVLFEHHANSQSSVGLGDSCGYDFVNHTWVNSTGLADSLDRDIVEHNGPTITGDPAFGFTSTYSSIWNGQVLGNHTSRYHKVTGFDYEGATSATVVAAWDTSLASQTIDSVQTADIIIGQIRNMDYFVVMRILDVGNGPNNGDEVFFRFEYKFTIGPTPLGLAEQEVPQTTPKFLYNPLNQSVWVKSNNGIETCYLVDQAGRIVDLQYGLKHGRVEFKTHKLSRGLFVVVVKDASGISHRQKFVKSD